MMSETQPENVPRPPENPEPGGELTGAERIFVRLTLWQTVLSVAGVFIAIVALYAALTESAAVRQQTASAVWPFVQLSIEDYDSRSAAAFTMSFTNAGVGPARMRAVRLVIDGEAVRDWRHAVEQVGGSLDAQIDRNFIGNRVLRPDETVHMVSTRDPELARRFQAAIANPANYLSYCYCSIFDECWLADSRRPDQDPEPVEQCPDFGDEAYRN
jgi:hypothetical protein